VLALPGNVMKRPLLLVILLVGLAAAIGITWATLERDKEYRRLLGEGEEALASGQTLSAIAAFSGAIALKRDSMAGWLKRGETYQRHGDLEAALRDLRTAAALDPAATRPLEELGDVHYAQGQFARAAERYEAYLRLDDQSARLLYKLGLARYRQGMNQGAIAPLRRAVALNDRFAEAYQLLGLALRKQGQTAEAVRMLHRAIRTDPTLAAAREALADIYGSAGRHGPRLEQLEALAALDVDRPERFLTLGMAQAEAGRVDLAVHTISRAVERKPGSSLAYSSLALVWLRLAERGDRAAIGKALEASRLAVATETPSSQALLVHGRAQMLAGRPDLALRTLRKATEHLPVEEEAFLYLGDAAFRVGRIREARSALLSYVALTDEPRRVVTTASRIAALSMRLNDAPTAVKWLTRASRLQPDEADLLVQLSDAHVAAGDRTSARDVLDRALGKGADPSTPTFRRLSIQLQKP
jgi:tetratricopeptide (TPR) repeat protein